MDDQHESEDLGEAQIIPLPFKNKRYIQRDVKRRELKHLSSRKLEKKPRKRKIEPDDILRRSIMGLAKMGKSFDEIADFVGVSKAFIHKHYRTEVMSGKEIANALVVENLYAQAMKDAPSSIQAGIYITKARMGWKDKSEEQEKAPQVVFDFTGLDYDERIRLMEKIKVKQGLTHDPDVLDGEMIQDE
jgi:hypothetical protein